MRKLREIIPDSKFTQALVIVIIVIYPSLFIWQDGHLTDVGLYAINYQYFFEDFNNGHIQIMTLFSDAVGGLWLHYFPGLGIFGLKLLYLIFLYGSIFLVYKILNLYSSHRTLLLIFIFAGVTFGIRYSPFVLNYDIISNFFILLSCLFLLKGIESNSKITFFLVGVTGSLLFITRFPSGLWFLFIPVVLYFSEFKIRNTLSRARAWRSIIIQYSLILLGLLATFIGLYGLIIMKEIDFYAVLHSTLNRSSGSYSYGALFYKYLNDVKMFLPYVFIIFSLYIVFGLLHHLKFSLARKLRALLLMVSFVTFLILIDGDYSHWNSLIYMVPAICLLPLVYGLLIDTSTHKKVGLLIFITLGYSIIQVIGSNTGLFLKLSYGSILFIPLSFLVLEEDLNLPLGNQVIKLKSLALPSIIVVIIFSLISRFSFIYHVNNGIESRFVANVPVDSKKMIFQYTTLELSNHITELCDAINRNMDDSSSLFIFGHEPIFYYLTDNKPAIRQYWVADNNIGITEILTNLREVLKTNLRPIILDTRDLYNIGEVKRDSMRKFLTTNNYSVLDSSKSYIMYR